MNETNQNPETTSCPCCHAEGLELNINLVTEPGNEPAIPKYINVRFGQTDEAQSRRYVLEDTNGSPSN